MKSFFFSNIKVSITALLLVVSFSAFSQKINIWKGGTPGQENDWNCPNNWTSNMVPNEFSDVVIPDVSTMSLASPVIYSGKLEINSLFLYSTAMMTINEPAQLLIHQQVEGINDWNVSGKGLLQLPMTLSLNTAATASKK